MKDFEKWMERILDAPTMADAGRALISFSYATTTSRAPQKYIDQFLMYLLERFSAYDRESRFYIAEPGAIVAASVLSRIRLEEISSGNLDIIRNLGMQFIFEFEKAQGYQISGVGIWMALQELETKFGILEAINAERKLMVLLFNRDRRKVKRNPVFRREYPDGSSGWQIELFPDVKNSSEDIGDRLFPLLASIIAREISRTWRGVWAQPEWVRTCLRTCGIEPDSEDLLGQIKEVVLYALLIDSRFAGPGTQIKLKELGLEKTAGYLGFLGAALKSIKESRSAMCRNEEGRYYSGQ